MPLYAGCERCGFVANADRNINYCPECGKKLKYAVDTREFASDTTQKEWKEYQRLKEKFTGR